MTARKLSSCSLFALLAWSVFVQADRNSLDLEQSVCGSNEPVLFEEWSRAAGQPDSNHLSALENVREISIQSKDRRILRGYKLKGSAPDTASAVNGYLLVVQGNAMLAGQIIGQFQRFAESGYDVFVFDYRGYGRSEGKPRFNAILSDYREIIDHLNSRAYKNSIFYGMSFGGVVLLDALKNKPGDSRIVIDSARSRFSKYGCPKENDPLNTLPRDCSNFLVIAGQRDRVVTPAASKELLELAAQRGASVLEHQKFDHPFMDTDRFIHNHRMDIVRSFLLNRE